MDAKQPISISPLCLHRALGTASSPLIVDVRRGADFDGDDRLIVGAARRDPAALARWQSAIPTERPVVAYCAHGHEVSQGVAAALREAGCDARYLEGGMEAWVAQGRSTRRKHGAASGAWVTRARPTIDRIACPWLIHRFIDPEASFLYVPEAAIGTTAARTGATPYDVTGAEFGHHGEFCSFDAFIRIYGIADAALDRLAAIVRGADTSRPDLTPQSAGLLAISQGLKANFTDDHAMLAQGMVLYDALYAWCRGQSAGLQA
jgi:rhodanese-related sulfurtransferase